MSYADHIPLARRMLCHNPKRLVISIGAVAFTVMIMFMEFGFFNGLIDSQASFPKAFDADLVMIAAEKMPIDKPGDFLAVHINRALAFSEVSEVIPIYESKAKFKNPQTKRIKTIYMVAFPVESHPFHWKGFDMQEQRLKRTNSILFDAGSRNIFGEIREGMEIEVNDRKLKVGGLVKLGPTFVRDGYVFMSDTTWNMLKGPDAAARVSYGLIRLKQNADLDVCQQKLEKVVSPDILVKTPEQIIRQETRIILRSTPTGALFGIGMILGFVIGVIICYQLLHNEIVDHMDQYATLRAMGFSKAYLCGIVVRKANLFSIAGFFFGFMLSFFLYGYLQHLTQIIMSLNPGRILFVFGLTVLMSNLAGLLSIKKVLEIDPAEIF